MMVQCPNLFCIQSSFSLFSFSHSCFVFFCLTFHLLLFISFPLSLPCYIYFSFCSFTYRLLLLCYLIFFRFCGSIFIFLRLFPSSCSLLCFSHKFSAFILPIPAFHLLHFFPFFPFSILPICRHALILLFPRRFFLSMFLSYQSFLSSAFLLSPSSFDALSILLTSSHLPLLTPRKGRSLIHFCLTSFITPFVPSISDRGRL